MDQDHLLQSSQRPSKVSWHELAATFLFIALTSFGGGISAYIRRIIVEEKQWMTDEEFFPGLAICQLLPGANVVGISLYVGNHLCGALGALIATFCIVVPPAFFLFGIGVLYFSFREIPMVASTLKGVAAVACGLMASMLVQSAKASLKNVFDIFIFLMTFALVRFAHLHVPYVILIIAPITIWWYRPKEIPVQSTK